MKKNSSNQKSEKERKSKLNEDSSVRHRSHEKTQNKREKEEDSSGTKKERNKVTENMPHKINHKKNVPQIEDEDQVSELSDSNLLLF